MEILDFNTHWVVRKETGEQRRVTLPDDAMLREKRDPLAKGGAAGAFFPGGVYEYEKVFFAPEVWKDKNVTFRFEGVYKNSSVILNGREIGGCAYGYSEFFAPADEALIYGAENTIKVIARNADQPNSRWYTGSGIYRPVWLYVNGKKHINIHGVKVTTISYKPSKIRVDVSHIGGDSVLVEILDDGNMIVNGSGDSVVIEIPNAKLWSETQPYLYQCRVSLLKNSTVVDDVTETFGIRMVEWNPNGLFVNGESVLLRGGCVHHDNGILGAASFAKAEERRVRILKEVGFSAIRSSHNPASEAMLTACDKLGMFVIDETWDMWYSHKNRNDYASDFEVNYKLDIKSMVDRDFNHPSVIMYSIANEVAEPHESKGLNLAKEIVGYIHSLDVNRAVTGGMNLMVMTRAAKGNAIYKDGNGAQAGGGVMNSSLMFNIIAMQVGSGMNKQANGHLSDKVCSPVLDALDIAGYNYTSGRYEMEGKLHPNRLIYGSETFPQDIAKNWAMVKRLPYLIGDFMWTAWDYLGEVGMGSWNYRGDTGFEKKYPYILAEGGAFDILGDPTGEVYHAAAIWGMLKAPAIAVRPVNHSKDKLTKAVWRGTNAIPSWSWKNCEGNKAAVEVYTDAHSVELLLNGKLVGKRRVKNCRAMFEVRYVMGTLEAVAFNRTGNVADRGKLVSASGKTIIKVTPEDTSIKPGEIVFVNVEIAGENGVRESNADTTLTVSVTGGELLAFGSANPRSEESYVSGCYTTHYGKALAVVRAGNAGSVQVNVTGDGLPSSSAVIAIQS